MNVVGFASLDDFIGELRREKNNIADRIVRWHENRSPEQEEQLTFHLEVWATAIAKCEDNDYLLEFEAAAGRDSEIDGDRSSEASQRAATARAKLAEACDDLGLQLRPGKIEVC